MNNADMTKQLAKFLQQQLNLANLNNIDSKQQLPTLRTGIQTWFESQCPIPAAEYLQRFAILYRLLLTGQYIKFSNELNELSLIQFALSCMPNLAIEPTFKLIAPAPRETVNWQWDQSLALYRPSAFLSIPSLDDTP